MIRRLLFPLFALILVAAACAGGDSDVAAAPDDSAAATVDTDDSATGDDLASTGDDEDCAQGQAFPDDPDFRQAVCRPLMAMTGLIGTDAVIDPEWGPRIGSATFNYSLDREAAMAELAAVLAEIQAAG